MKTRLQLLFVILGCCFSNAAETPLGSAFLFQGSLSVEGQPANGSFDLRCTLYDADSGGAPAGGPVTNLAVVVNNGLFALPLDFGEAAFNGNARWLQIGIRTNGATGAFTYLSPNQRLLPTPYAIRAGSVPGDHVTGTVPDSVLSANIPRLDAAGTFAAPMTFSSPNGVTIQGRLGIGTSSPVSALHVAGTITAQALQSTGQPFWIGTLDNQPLELRVNGQRALRLEPNNSNPPTVIAGAPSNVAEPGVMGGTINGGYANILQGNTWYPTIGGGENNTIQGKANESFIGGGNHNTVASNASYAVIIAGEQNLVQSNAYAATIAGGSRNVIESEAKFATIAGGSISTIGARADYATIVGGGHNEVEVGAWGGAINGGYSNTLYSNAYLSVIGGGWGNSIQTNSSRANIGGGENNRVGIDANHASIGGGFTNNIQARSPYSVISGGLRNTIQTGTSYATIAGGGTNNIGTNATGGSISGGLLNSLENNVRYSSIGGGYFNTIRDPSMYGMIPGGFSNVVDGNYSFAAGRRAQAVHNGCFVWADSTDRVFASARTNLFLIRANGVGINTNNPAYLLHVNGTAGKPGGGSWSVASDARLKTNVTQLANALDRLLALRGVSFEYRQPEAVCELPGRQIGMLAQEVEAVFPDWVDEGADGFKRVTFRGFEALTVEALRDLRRETDAHIEQLRSENRSLRQQQHALEAQNRSLAERLATLEQTVAALAASHSDREAGRASRVSLAAQAP